MDNSQFESAKTAPGPKGWPLIGCLPQRLKNPLAFYPDLARKYGPVANVKIGGWNVYGVSDPDGIKRVLVDNVKNYTKGKTFARIKPVFGEGLLTSDGDFWRRQRKLAQPAFHMQSIARLCDDIRKSTERMLKKWKKTVSDGSAFAISKEMTQLTLSIISQTLLGLDVGSRADKVGRAVSQVLSYSSRKSLALFPFDLPTPDNLRSRKAIKELDAIVYEIIAERKKSTDAPHDLLDMLMSAQDELTGEKMSEVHLRDEIMTIFIAGHETTANALAWTWYLLGKHPEVFGKMREEVDRILPDHDPSFTDLPKLAYTKQVFEEALRLYPPAWTFSRTAVEDDVICGFKIPRGSIVAIATYLMHRHPDYWENPEKFDPDRFTPEKIAQRHRYVYIPFGGGPRQCIGNQFAMSEALIILSMIVRRYDLLPLEQEVKPEALLTLRPAPGVKVLLKKRFTP